jgi:DNA-binding response OmpR family regulator
MIPLLLIEDQVELCQILKDTLSLYGFDVTYALMVKMATAYSLPSNPKSLLLIS